MTRKFKVISMDQYKERTDKKLPFEEKLQLLQKVNGVVLKDAQGIWADIWNDLQGCEASGDVVSPELEKSGFEPECGWAEFMEKMWLLKHYLHYAKKVSDGEI